MTKKKNWNFLRLKLLRKRTKKNCLCVAEDSISEKRELLFSVAWGQRVWFQRVRRKENQE